MWEMQAIVRNESSERDSIMGIIVWEWRSLQLEGWRQGTAVFVVGRQCLNDVNAPSWCWDREVDWGREKEKNSQLYKQRNNYGLTCRELGKLRGILEQGNPLILVPFVVRTFPPPQLYWSMTEKQKFCIFRLYSVMFWHMRMSCNDGHSQAN